MSPFHLFLVVAGSLAVAIGLLDSGPNLRPLLAAAGLMTAVLVFTALSPDGAAPLQLDWTRPVGESNLQFIHWALGTNLLTVIALTLRGTWPTRGLPALLAINGCLALFYLLLPHLF